MKTKNVLFIVEGTNDEPHFIKQLLSKCYPSYNYKIYSYEESNKEIFNLKYTDVFMIFDFEPQHSDQRFDTIQKHTTSFLLSF